MTVNYSLGKIYTLINIVDKTIYVGSTAQVYLSSRMGAHRIHSKESTRTSPLYTAMRLHGTDSFKMLLHHLFPCTTKAELEAEEYRLLDQLIADGKQVYNETIGHKHSEKTKSKMALAQKGAKEGNKHPSFNYGCVRLDNRTDAKVWFFKYVPINHPNTQKGHSFSCNKYGFWKAKAMCDDMRKLIYPQYRDDEERCIEAFMNIDL